MDKLSERKIFYLPLLFAALLCFSLFSCAEDKINIITIRSSHVFDYGGAGEPKLSQHLSVFAEFSSNVRRLDYMTVVHQDYTWSIENPLMLEGEAAAWAGYMRLEPPPHLGRFPEGLYTVECVDAMGNKAQGNFAIEDRSDLVSSDFWSYEFDEEWRKQIAVYSIDGELIFFDAYDGEITDSQEVLESVEMTAFLRDNGAPEFLRYVMEHRGVTCLSPKIYKEGS